MSTVQYAVCLVLGFGVWVGGLCGMMDWKANRMMLFLGCGSWCIQVCQSAVKITTLGVT